MRTAILVCLAAAVTVAVASGAPPPTVPRDTQPWWSPQGTTVAFYRESPTIETGDVIFTPAVRGSEADLLGEGKPRGFRSGSGELLVERGSETTVRDAATHALATIPGTDATWSPDGSRIAFLQGDALSVATASGAVVQRLATNVVPAPGDTAGPVWSPDGTAIAIANGSAIEVIATDGSGVHVAFDQPGVNADPSWSRDGATIAFDRLADGRWSIWLVSPDGSNPREAPVAATANARFPQWSPVDARLAFISDRSGRYALYVGTADGPAQELIDAVNPGSPPRWSPDGRELAVSSARDCARFGIYVVRASGPTQAVRRSNECRIVGTSGADYLVGSPYFDRIDGKGGADRLFGAAGDDVITGGPGNDGIGGGPGNDVIDGGPGNDILSGGKGNDVIYAGPGRDRIGCGPGVDTVYLQPGDSARDCEHVRYR